MTFPSKFSLRSFITNERKQRGMINRCKHIMWLIECGFFKFMIVIRWEIDIANNHGINIITARQPTHWLAYQMFGVVVAVTHYYIFIPCQRFKVSRWTIAIDQLFQWWILKTTFMPQRNDFSFIRQCFSFIWNNRFVFQVH